MAINLGLYGPGGRWSMTERGEGALDQAQGHFRVGPSQIAWDGRRLTAEIDEVAAPWLTHPWPARLRGRLTVEPEAVTDVEVALDRAGAHVWRPFAPVARIAVEIDRPGWHWQGHGYLDGNFGTRALEADFRSWTWARLPHRTGALAFYDAVRRDGSRLDLALGFDAEGRVRPLADAPASRPMARSAWAVARTARADPGSRPRQVMAMLDTPFYARSLVETVLWGERLRGMHEALDLDRFANPAIRCLLPVRMPRRAGRPR